MKTEVTLIAGHDTNEAREMRVLDWLRKHGATIEEWNGLLVVTVQSEKPSEGQYKHEYVVGFEDRDGNPEQSYLSISLEPNPYDTCLDVEYEGSCSCTCRGRGCTKCNEELAMIERGENPWQHHTVK